MRTILFLVVGLWSFPVFGEAAGEGFRPSAARAQQLIHMVRQDCGSCHGMTLRGGLGPALTPQALQGKPLESLVATILRGRAGTPMPPWQRFMSEAEAGWIVERLLDGFPE